MWGISYNSVCAVIIFGKYGRQVGWIVKYGKYGRKEGKDMKNMEENMEEK